MDGLSSSVFHLAGSLQWKRDATEQGGLLTGEDPSAFTTTDPLKTWIIQLGVIMMITQLLALILRRIRQPKVIAEVIGGILLGPTAFGRIPGFTQHIFPAVATPYLSLVANIGLCLFLFLVGLEIDWSVVKRNMKKAPFIALAGITLPFGLGAALSVPLYHHFISSSVKYTNFMLFTGVAYSITAFPVLCRILTELKLLDTHVGVTVLSAGVIDDIVGWTLLALSVALVNAGSGLTCLWILLITVAWGIVLFVAVKPAVYWLARRTGSIENGPTMFFMTVIILLMFGSAFFTDVIGVQAIFGAFLVGLIIPREGGLCIALTEKLEDMVQIIFLPLYFTLSGLNTNLGLLNDGITWGFTIAIMTLSFSGKFSGCTIAAKILGFSWREAGTIGSFMSCKGLVELIVLNVGLSAGILTQKVFSMFVLEAVVLTFMTTPLVNKFYPPSMRVRLGHHTSHPDVNSSVSDADEKGAATEKINAPTLEKWNEVEEHKSRFTVVLDRIEHLPGMMVLTQLIQPAPIHNSSPKEKVVQRSSDICINALRLVELSDRTSAVMRSSNTESMLRKDPLLNIFGTFGRLHRVSVSASLAVVPYEDLSSSVLEHAQDHGSQLVLVPWVPAPHSTDNMADMPSGSADGSNPFEALFRAAGSGPGQASSTLHSNFVCGIFAQARTDIALFIDHQHPSEFSLPHGEHHLFLPFFGGPDDRLALNFVVQLCSHPGVSATVVRMTNSAFDELDRVDSLAKPKIAYLGSELPHEATIHSVALPDTVYDVQTTQTRMQSETADNVIWARYNSRQSPDSPLSGALTRIQFSEIRTPTPLHTVVEHANSLAESTAERRAHLIVMVGRSRRLAVVNHHGEITQLTEQYGGSGGDVKKTVGDVAAILMAARCKSDIVVLQAAKAG
ncbi:Sodium/hydrogen exchanger family-domain-containing protein [Rhodofomes roseus]|uniref:Sodium/hydrogen exchanger family-domain-containing protein n=1 Tax=Rhodofomes roseus TaxID=34475 RepID=A0ABQ8KSW8_9APHY|nr:Sodium/hydrogen exchanger family-domain-containing protein [Rhodofomes roseus]KAH9841680.1 Sodium/hydrogen exchanger family-domain-containing protein [Rhodofomes roseus]